MLVPPIHTAAVPQLVNNQLQLLLKMLPHSLQTKAIGPVVVDGDGWLNVPHLMVPTATTQMQLLAILHPHCSITLAQI